MVLPEMVQISCANDGGIEFGQGNGEADHEFDPAHAVQDVIQGCFVPAIAHLFTGQHVIPLVPVRWRASRDSAANDDTSAGGGGLGDDSFMLALHGGVRTWKTSNRPESICSCRFG